MKITKLKLVNFRNYSKLDISFDNNMNIFIGDNAQGKTNVLEAIVILALTKSHRDGVNQNIIMFNKNKCKISGTIRNEDIINKLNISISPEEKQLNINNTIIKKVADYISYLNIIVFTPDDIEIIKGSPGVRRNLLNIQLSQLSREYLKIYNEYNKLLKTRNEYLKILFNNNIADNNYLDIITDKLIEKAIYIYLKRNEYINLVNLNINRLYNEMGENSTLSVEYTTNVVFDNFDIENIRKKLKYTYKKNYMKELNNGMTIYGPHRDDFYFKYNDKDLKYFGSQGQQKLAVLSLKLSEISIFKDISGTSPILLFDDVFSELDIKKRNKLLKIINENETQSIITTTDLKNINKKYIDKSAVFIVKNGVVERK